MCINCLQNELNSIKDYDKEVSEYLAKIACPCYACASFPDFLKHINQGLMIVCLAKIKRGSEEGNCPHAFRRLIHMERKTKEKIKAELSNAMEKITEATEYPEMPLCEGKYLKMADELKGLHECMERLDEADHR
jgi:hypothetical protein